MVILKVLTDLVKVNICAVYTYIYIYMLLMDMSYHLINSNTTQNGRRTYV